MTKLRSLQAMERESKRLGQALAQHYLYSLIAGGYIDPRGKSDDVLRDELKAYVQKAVESNALSKTLVISYDESLVIQARGFAKARSYEQACLFYATWFEHWINHLLLVGPRSRLLSLDEIKLLIRDTGLRAKYSCMPTILGLPRLSKAHIGTVFHLSELRNSFVHYKFAATVVDAPERENAWKTDLDKVEKAVKYFRNYELKQVFKGQKSRAKKVIKPL